MAIRVVVDSSVDLPEDDLMHKSLTVIPLTVSFGDKHYLDRKEITPEEFHRRMNMEKELPKTAQPSPGRFLEVFDRCGAKGERVICLCLSSGLSGSYNSALLARGMTDTNVEVIDTQTGSAGMGILTKAALSLVESGKTDFSKIVAKIKDYAQELKVYALLDTVENAVKGGRLSPVKGVLATILNLKIIVEVKNGTVQMCDKVRGAKRAYERLIELFLEKTKERTIPLIGIAHVANETGALALKELLQKVCQEAEFFVTTMGATIGTYAGQGGIVLAF